MSLSLVVNKEKIGRLITIMVVSEELATIKDFGTELLQTTLLHAYRSIVENPSSGALAEFVAVGTSARAANVFLYGKCAALIIKHSEHVEGDCYRIVFAGIGKDNAAHLAAEWADNANVDDNTTAVSGEYVILDVGVTLIAAGLTGAFIDEAAEIIATLDNNTKRRSITEAT